MIDLFYLRLPSAHFHMFKLNIVSGADPHQRIAIFIDVIKNTTWPHTVGTLGGKKKNDR